MFDLGGDTLMAQVLTDVIIANTKGDGKGDHFWDNGEANLLKSLILYVDLDSTRRPEERNLPAVYQMLTQNTEKQLTALFDRLPLDHPARAPYSLFSQASDSVRAGVVLGLGTRLQVLRWAACMWVQSVWWILPECLSPWTASSPICPPCAEVLISIFQLGLMYGAAAWKVNPDHMLLKMYCYCADIVV